MMKQDRASIADTSSNTKEAKEDEEETPKGGDHLDAYAIIPPNGGWGWLVVMCAFYCNVVVDGIQLTFGVFLGAIAESFQTEVAEVALAGSLMFGVHMLIGPACAAFSKVFGLRPVTITGSLICCFGVAVSYFAQGNWFLYISFGVTGGIGLGLVYMNSLMITSVYFTTLMPIAIAIVVCGTGVGTMVFAALGNYLLNVTTWQNSFLIQAALAGSMAFAAASFKPLKPVKVQVSPIDSSGGIKHRHSSVRESSSKTKAVYIKTMEGVTRTSNTSLRTVNSIIWSFIEEGVVSKETNQRCKCSCRCCKKKEKKASDSNVLVLSEVRNASRRKSYVEKALLQEVEEEHPSPRYGSAMSFKTVFQKKEFEKRPKKKALDVIKRTLQAMFDCHLMTSYDFVRFTLSGALQITGFLIVYIYEKERCLSMGFTEDMSVNFIIFLGGANVFWRLFLGGLATHPKVNYWLLSIITTVIGGLATTISGFYLSVYYQIGFCFFFGMGIASFAVFRIVLLVDLVGKEKVENATGINILFMGIFCIISPPFFGWLKQITHSYDMIFIVTGILTIISGMMLIGLQRVRL